MNQRPYHHGNLRSELLAAAERCLRERGAQQLSLRELARDVGVSHAAPRRHFPDRQALLDALAENGFQRLGTELREACRRAEPQFEAQLSATAAAYIVFATRDPALLELMYAGKHRQDANELRHASERAMSVIHELIRQGQALGALEPGEPDRAGLVLFAIVQGIASLVTAGIVHPDQVDELLTDAITRFLRGDRL
ncbi:MAG: TetR/AcrR family transcriptional regulator [Solirubrobacteraceae bacterium]